MKIIKKELFIDEKYILSWLLIALICVITVICLMMCDQCRIAIIVMIFCCMMLIRAARTNIVPCYKVVFDDTYSQKEIFERCDVVNVDYPYYYIRIESEKTAAREAIKANERK